MKYSVFWEGRPYGIILMTCASDGCTSLFNEKIGTNITQAVNIYKNGKDSWLFRTDEVLEGGKIIVEKIKNQDFLKKNSNDIYEWTSRLDKVSKRIVDQDLKSKSDKELIELFKDLIKTFNEFYGVAFVPIFLECGENILSKLSEEIVRKKLKELGKEDQFADYYISLVGSPTLSAMVKEELGLLNIIDKVIEIDVDSKSLKNHIKEWEWISFNFFDRIGWGKEEYKDRIKEILKQSFNEKIKEIEKRSEKLLIRKKEILSELNFDEKESKIIEATEKYGEIKEFRKNMILLSWYRLHFLLEEIARRKGVDVTKLRFLLPHEVEKIFEHFDEKLVEERKKQSVVITENGFSRVLIGEEYNEFMKNVIIEDIVEEVSELKGMPACKGNIKGKVRIVNELKDSEDFDEGDILVSTATFPELLPVMKKSGAIITDEGGVTCHAAIVSRELDIPCVIGTKIATKILKNGDLVEVDASKGIIRRI